MDLAVKDIRRYPRRFFLSCVGVGMLLMVVMGMGGIFRGLIDDATSLINSVGADIWLVQKDTNGPFAEDSRIPEDLKHTVRSLDGVAEAGAMSFQSIQIDRGGKQFRVFAVGYDTALGLGGPKNIVEGRAIMSRHYETVAGVESGLGIGERLMLGGDGYTVVGLTKNVVSPSGDPLIYLGLPDAQNLQFKKDDYSIRNDRTRLVRRVAAESPGMTLPGDKVGELAVDTHVVNAVVVRAKDGYPADRLAGDISRWKHYRTASTAEQTGILTKGMVRKSKMQLGLFSAILLAVSVAVIAMIMYTHTMYKTREIATLKLIGAPEQTIVRMIVEQSLLMGFVAYWIGFVLIHLTYQYFPKRMVLFSSDLRAIFVIVMISCVLASVAGLRSALKVDPAQALGG